MEVVAVEAVAVAVAEVRHSNVKTEFVLQWHITHRCNLRCRHCYQHDYTAFFDDRKIMQNILSQFEELLNTYHYRGHINITGGEPTLHKDLWWLLKECAERNISTALLTNGTTLTVQDAERLKAFGITYAQISLDGCEKIHEAIRGKDSFHRAVNGITALKSQGIYTDVSFTVQRENIKELKPLSKLCYQMGVDKLWFDRVVIPKDEDKQHLSLDRETYRKFCQSASKLNRKGKVSCARALQFLPCKNKHIYHCTAGKTLLTLLADGTVMPCRRLPLIAGNVKKNDLLSIYQNSPLLQQLRNTTLPSECSNCLYANDCQGGAKCIAYARTEKFDVRDPDCFI